jgi:hypothetical protein
MKLSKANELMLARLMLWIDDKLLARGTGRLPGIRCGAWEHCRL